MSVECYCGSHRAFSACCQPYIECQALPERPEQLMRSRYSAFALANKDYILQTWCPLHRPTVLNLDSNQKWLGLKVVRAGQLQERGFVEFIARYRVGGGRAERLHELSEFVRVGDQWLYVKATDFDSLGALGG